MEIYIFQNGEQLGPYSREAVFQGMHSGKLKSDDPAWHEGMEDWKPLGEVLRGMVAVPIPVATPTPRAPVLSTARPSRQASGAGVKVQKKPAGGWFMKLVVLALVAGGAAWAYYNPKQVEGWIAQGRQWISPSGQAAAGVSNESTGTAIAVATKPSMPAAKSAAAAASPANPVVFDLASLAATPARWPKTVTLRKAVTFPIVLGGQVKGSISLPAGAEVNLKTINGLLLTVERNGGEVKIPAGDTDIAQRVQTAMSGTTR